MKDINAIRARLGSISDSSMSKLPKAVQTLLKEDLPRLVEVAEAAIGFVCMGKDTSKMGTPAGLDHLRGAVASL